MLAYCMSRGLTLPKDRLDEIGGLVEFLTLGIDRRYTIPMASLYRMHRLLTESISPALPRSIELLHWDARNNPKLHGFAPVPAVRWLIYATLCFFVFVVVGIVFYSFVESGGSDAQVFEVFHSTLFLLALAGLGACFSILYDARRHVVEGTYDPRMGSNYWIRILLGIVSGLILTQLLSEYVEGTTGEAGTATSFSLPLLALVGGFASQFVYKALNRIVEALSSIFDPSPQEQVENRAREIRVETAESSLAASTDRMATVIDVVNKIRQDPNEAQNPKVLQQLLSIAGSTTLAVDATKRVFGSDNRQMSNVENAVAAGKVLATVLPDGGPKSVLSKVTRLATEVKDIKSLAQSGAAFDAIEALATVADELGTDSPVSEIVTDAVRALSRVAGVANPAGMAIALVLGTTRLTGVAYDRWKVRILGAAFKQKLMPPGMPNSAAALSILRALPEAAGLLGGQHLDNPAALNSFAQDAIAGRDDELFAKFGAGSGLDAGAFAGIVAAFRQHAVGEALLQDLPQDVIDEAGVEDAAQLFDLFDDARADQGALKAIDQLFLLAANTDKIPGAREGVLTALRALGREIVT